MADNKQPNLTTDLVGGTLAKGNLQRYASLTECSEARSIPLGVLSLAKRKNAPGFKANGGIYWDELQPFLAQNFTTLLTGSTPVSEEENNRLAVKREKLELEKLAEEVKKLRNLNRKSDSEYIN